MELPNAYNAKEVEKKWQDFWEKSKIYKFDPDSKKKIFSIDTPPPYASAGHLHIGHALHYTQFEIIARAKRMLGYNVYFAPCFDNNGLPTERYVESKFNISKDKTTKAEFRELCLKESKIVEAEYANRVFKLLGHSYDWDLLYTTIGNEAQKVSQTSFVDLYKKGHLYRGEEPTLWCTFHQTAIAQAEVEDKERTTKLNYINFGLEDGGKIEIATTRPEFLAACVGIFVHPDDKRYEKLVGKNAIVPLFNLKVPIMKDTAVDPEFGSGIVMICTFGDTTDINWWKTHRLPLRIILTKDGKLNEHAGPYKGMGLDAARAAILDDLKAKGNFIKDEPLKQTVGACWRCGTPIEFIVAKQWFIRTLDYKKELIAQANKINWHPEFFKKRFEDWTNNLAWDWCISRQRFYGVPIPVWYCKKCGEVMIPDEKDLPLDPEQAKPKNKCKCGSSEFEPEHDVFDTWMTSSMSPEIAIRWLEKPKNFKKMLPMTLRPQSHDIIRTWAFYTILKSYLHFKSIPWKDILIGTFVLDPQGRGMHKSKGNAIWTHELLDKFNVDVVRYWVGTANFGDDLPFKEKDLIAGQKFQTKLWNASRFAIMHLKDYDNKKPKKLELYDKALLSKLNKLAKQAAEYLEAYRVSDAKKIVEYFFWHDLCDNYLEVVKDRMYNADKRGKDARRSAQYALYTALLAILKMIAPIMPHITEEIYQSFFKQFENAESIHISGWPEYDKKMSDEVAEKAGAVADAAVEHARRAKSEQNLSLKSELKELAVEAKISEKDFDAVKEDVIGATKAVTVLFKNLDESDKKDIEIHIKL